MQEFENKLREKLLAVKFEIPRENLLNLLEPFKRLMEVASLERLQCDVETHSSILNELLKEKPDFNLYNISFLINSLTRVSPTELEMPAYVYNKVIFYSSDLAKQWNTVVAPIQKKLQNDFNNRMVLEAKNNGKKPTLITK